MMGSGRPLRFLILVLGAWIGMRTWQLWPDPPVPPVVRDVVRRVVAEAERPVTGEAFATTPAVSRTRASPHAPPPTLLSPRSLVPQRVVAPPLSETMSAPAPRPYVLGLLSAVRYGAPEPAPPAASRRWSASGWAIVRGAGSASGVATPQLGGGQAGLRVARTLDARGRVAVAARVAAALGTRQQEAAIGVEWRPTALPVRMVVERRIGVAGFRGGTGLGLVGGVSEMPLPAGFRLDGYAQAGAVIRERADGYADGAVRVARPVWDDGAGMRLSLGLGAWGAAQRGAQRLDIGPAATLEVPVGDVQRVRIALEWRQRVAGDARPGSGPALSIGTDY